MATASSFVSEDQFLCSICLEVFTEPVSTPCGHNFCKACISRHWEGKDQCQCPLCNENFDEGLKLRVNTGFRDVVENFRKFQSNKFPVKPGQVACDCCPGTKVKATKTCLVCLTSYCKTHLEPHQRVAALKRHKLVHPEHHLKGKINNKHNNNFCRNDQTCACVLCTEHSTHDTVPLGEACVDKMAQIGMNKAEVQEMKPKRRKKAKKQKIVAIESEKGAKEEAIVSSMEPNYASVPYILFPTESPQQLNTYTYLPGHVGFSEGKFYYEVKTKGKTGWYLGIVRESILWKSMFTLNSRNGNWMMRLDNNTNCTALDNVPVNLFLTKTPERVTVFVDYDNGSVSFYDADSANLIYTFAGCNFKERIFLFYCPAEDVSWTQKLLKKVPDILLSFALICLTSNIF